MTSMPASRSARAMILAPAVVTVEAGLGHHDADLAAALAVARRRLGGALRRGVGGPLHGRASLLRGRRAGTPRVVPRRRTRPLRCRGRLPAIAWGGRGHVSGPRGASRRPAEVELPGGQSMQVRPLREDDRDVVESMFERLGEESRYRRFLSPKKRLSERELRTHRGGPPRPRGARRPRARRGRGGRCRDRALHSLARRSRIGRGGRGGGRRLAAPGRRRCAARPARPSRSPGGRAPLQRAHPGREPRGARAVRAGRRRGLPRRGRRPARARHRPARARGHRRGTRAGAEGGGHPGDPPGRRRQPLPARAGGARGRGSRTRAPIRRCA